MSLFAALLLWLQVPATLSGLYHTQQMEVGAALELKADGTFHYMLDYGAVSEAAEGHWRADGDTIILTSDPLSRELMQRIERNDAGFKEEPLAIDGDRLVLRRYDMLFTFYRGEP